MDRLLDLKKKEKKKIKKYKFCYTSFLYTSLRSAD
jgi:hypothetical protein